MSAFEQGGGTNRHSVPWGRKKRERSAVRDIAPQDIAVVFQPIVDLKSKKLFAAECLVRCKWPIFRSPLDLFHAASEFQTTGKLGRVIREVSFENIQIDRLFLNLHPEELESSWLVRPDDPLCMYEGDLYLEITETTMIKYFDLCDNVLREVCARTGAKLAIDDLGAGYSNFKRLVDLEPAVVKLDMSLIRDIHLHDRQRILVRHLVELCTDLGAKVVGEGVEVADELKVLIDLGVHFGQGYLLAKPAAEIPEINWPAL